MEIKLTAEQMEKIKACKTAEEIKKLAIEDGIEFTDEQLEKITGGVSPNTTTDNLNWQGSNPSAKADPTYDKLVK